MILPVDAVDQELRDMLSYKKEQFAVEIRRKKNDSRLHKNRESITLKFSQFNNVDYEKTEAATVYEGIVREYFMQNQMISSNLKTSNPPLSEQEYLQSLKNLEEFPSNQNYYSILKSMIFINSYLRINLMCRVDISQQIIENLAKMIVSYSVEKTPENYFISVMALQSISVIAFFPINTQILNENLLSSLFTWVNCKIPQLEGNCFQAIHDVAMSDEVLTHKLITQYNLVEVSLITLQNIVSRLKNLSSANSTKIVPTQNQMEEMSKELIDLILKLLQDCFLLVLRSEERQDVSQIQYSTIIITSIVSLLKDYEQLSNLSLNICSQIINIGITQKNLFDCTFQAMRSKDTISVFYQIAAKYLFGFTESKTYQRIVENILNVICHISAKEDQLISSTVCQSKENLEILVQLLLKERSKVNISSLKILHNICFENKEAAMYIIENKSFWDNILIITEFSSNTELVNEILILLYFLISYLSKQSLEIFLGIDAMKIFLFIFAKSPTCEMINYGFGILSIVFDFMLHNNFHQQLIKFTTQCNQHKIIQFAEHLSSQYQNADTNHYVHFFLDKVEKNTENPLLFETQNDYFTDYLATVKLI